MGKIQQLPESIAVKIAAGEVVERPASVLKELVENSIDAGATQVEVTLRDGGKSFIEVKDNGQGMDREDAVSAFLRHGTSKIRDVDDLLSVMTLGFRGEALAAIGASGEIELITTEPKSEEGSKVSVSNGIVSPVKPHAPIPGTMVRVTELFSNIPARQKFLKSEASEWKACLDVMMKHLIAHPAVGFVVKHNDRIVFDVPTGQQLPARVAETWRLEQSKLVEVFAEVPHLTIQGVVAKPEVSHEGKSRQFFTINGHPITDKSLAKAVRDGFGTLLPPAMYPSFALNLTIHPGMVDVNIHPRKDEVRFVNPQEIYRLILHAVSQALERENVAFTNLQFTTPPTRDSDSTIDQFITKGMPERYPEIKFESAPSYTRSGATHSPVRHAGFDAAPLRSMMEVQAPYTITAPILVLDNCYLITVRDGKLLFIDQHAAHERILYNKLWLEDEAKAITRQTLLLPAELTLDEGERAVFEQHRPAFEAIGFGFTEPGGADLYILEMPHLIKQADPVGYFHQLLKGLGEDRSEPELTDFKHKLYATMACKAAVKAGDSISESEKRQLIEDLFSTQGGFTCPHGRPSHIEITGSEFEKLFKRTGF